MHSIYVNVNEWISNTIHLSAEEEGFLNRLFHMQVISDKPLLENNSLFKRVRASSDEEKTIVKEMLKEFFVETENGFIHPECKKFITTKSPKERGKMGGRPPNQKLKNNA